MVHPISVISLSMLEVYASRHGGAEHKTTSFPNPCRNCLQHGIVSKYCSDPSQIACNLL